MYCEGKWARKQLYAYKEGPMCNNWNIPEMELAQYTIQDGIEVDGYESLTLGLLGVPNGGPPPKHPDQRPL